MRYLGTKFAAEIPTRLAIYMPCVKEIDLANPKIQANEIFFCFFFISHTYKFGHKTQKCTKIELNPGTYKGLMKVHLHTNLGWNLTKRFTVIMEFLHKKLEGLSCLHYRADGYKEESWHLDGVTIVGIPFCDLKGIGEKKTEI